MIVKFPISYNIVEACFDFCIVILIMFGRIKHEKYEIMSLVVHITLHQQIKKLVYWSK